MFTVCPKCALTLTVTAADLRIAQGFVRCGQCTNVFNALLALSDERLQGTGVHAQASAAPPTHEESVEEESLPEASECAHEDAADEDLPPEDLAAEELPHEEFVAT
ncbi:MAG TPA: MJ0042-type zinc finger domain-containing protein, partial [Steroidobacteraceae bacterium]